MWGGRNGLRSKAQGPRAFFGTSLTEYTGNKKDCSTAEDFIIMMVSSHATPPIIWRLTGRREHRLAITKSQSQMCLILSARYSSEKTSGTIYDKATLHNEIDSIVFEQVNPTSKGSRSAC